MWTRPYSSLRDKLRIAAQAVSDSDAHSLRIVQSLSIKDPRAYASIRLLRKLCLLNSLPVCRHQYFLFAFLQARNDFILTCHS